MTEEKKKVAEISKKEEKIEAKEGVETKAANETEKDLPLAIRMERIKIKTSNLFLNQQLKLQFGK